MRTVEETKMSGETYEAPQCKIIEMQVEGVLLSGSVGASHDGYGNNDNYGW